MEFRQCDKTILDSVFSPMLIKRQPPFTFKPEYEHLKEEPREIYLSSAWYKSHWMWNLIKEAILGIYDGSSVVLCMDYAISVKSLTLYIVIYKANRAKSVEVK